MALEELTVVTDAVIVKQDLNTGGLGNVVVVIGNEVERALGATQLVRATEKADFRDIAERLWQQLTGPRNTQLVVEVYHPSATSFRTRNSSAPTWGPPFELR